MLEGNTFEIGVLKSLLSHKSQLLAQLPKSSFSDITLEISHTGNIYVMEIRKCYKSEWLHHWTLFIKHREGITEFKDVEKPFLQATAFSTHLQRFRHAVVLAEILSGKNIKTTVRKYWVIKIMAQPLLASSSINGNTQFHSCYPGIEGLKIYVDFHDQVFSITKQTRALYHLHTYFLSMQPLFVPVTHDWHKPEVAHLCLPTLMKTLRQSSSWCLPTTGFWNWDMRISLNGSCRDLLH